MKKDTIFNFINSIRSDLNDITKDNLEIIIDEFLEEGLIKEVPIIGNIFGAISISNKVKDWFFARKIYKFLFELSEIDQTKRSKFIEMLDDKDQRYRVGEELLITIERLDHLDKAKYLGKLFKHYILEHIEYRTFILYSSILERIFITDLVTLVTREYIDVNLRQRLFSLGIYHIDVQLDGPVFNINEIGDHLVRLLGTEYN